MARLSGALTLGLLDELGRFGSAMVGRHGEAPAIIDLTHVRGLGISMQALTERADAKPVLTRELRVYVCPTDETYGLARLFAAHQDLGGFRAPRVVRSLAEAFSALGVKEEDFDVVPAETYLQRG